MGYFDPICVVCISRGPTGFNGLLTFELVYGRPVRGPLDILMETWEMSHKSSESVISYVLEAQERLAKMADLTRENLGKDQQTQKRWYDRHARDREFRVGDHVLVLLHTSSSKLYANWQGPYPILRKIGTVNYEANMTISRRRQSSMVTY